MKVLVADPDWRFAEHLCSHLESHAHLVVHQPAPQEALARAVHWRPDLVVLAAEFAEYGLLEELSRLRPRPAILLTEHMDRYDRAWRAWQQGGDELLMKPVFTRDDVHSAIVAALENAANGTRRRTARAASA